MKAMFGHLVISLLPVLGFVTVSVGQISPQPLYMSDVASDTQCLWDVNDQNCTTGAATGCTSVAVTVQNTGHYYLHTWVECAPGGPHCGGCYACAHLRRTFDGAMIISPCHTEARCDDYPTSCDSTCPASPGATLQAGVEYTLYVCKRPCGANDCAHCDPECIAKAQIHG